MKLSSFLYFNFLKNPCMWFKNIQTVKKKKLYNENKSLFHTSPPGLHKTRLPTLLFIHPEIILCIYKHIYRYAPCFAQMVVYYIDCFPQCFFFNLTYPTDFCISRYRAGFLSRGTTGAVGCVTLHCGACAMHCRTCSSSPGLHPLHASSAAPPSSVVTTKNVSRLGQMSSGG